MASIPGSAGHFQGEGKEGGPQEDAGDHGEAPQVLEGQRRELLCALQVRRRVIFPAGKASVLIRSQREKRTAQTIGSRCGRRPG